MNTSKPANISRIPPPAFPRPSKEILVKSKFYKKKKVGEKPKDTSKGHSYTQVSKNNIVEIVNIKNSFLNLLAKKIEEVYKVLNKPKLNMITKGSSRRQVIILMSLNNFQKFMLLSNKHVFNINRTLKDIKSDIMADFICTNNRGLIITTNKVVLILNLCQLFGNIKL